MTLAEQASFAPLVHPLKPWDPEGQVWAVCIQDGKVTENPELRNEGTTQERGWTEIRLEYMGGGNGKPRDWTFVVAASDGVSYYEVYIGAIIDRQLFTRILCNAMYVREYAGLLLSSK